MAFYFFFYYALLDASEVGANNVGPTPAGVGL